MFQNLPLEITLNIASRLKFKDKLNLKKTCRKLNDQIAKAVLYEELDLFDSECGTKYYKDIIKENDKTIEKLINAGFEGSLVKVLHFDIGFLSPPNLSRLSDLFPNVNRVITAKKDKHYNSSSDYQDLRGYKKHIVNPLIKWRNNIKKIDTQYDWRMLKSDIMQRKYPQLTELVLSGLDDTLESCIRNPKLTFFQNAPLLTALTLRDAGINLNILEAVHSGFPLIKSLTLVDPYVTFRKGFALPPSIEPTSTVLFLRIYNPRRFYKNGVLLDYITKKYADLQRLVYDVDPVLDYSIKTRDDFNDSDGFNYSGKFSDSGDNEDSDGFVDSDDEFERRVSTEIAKSESNFLIYSAVESKFFSNLPKSIKALTIRINNLDNALAALAEANMDVHILDMTYDDPYTIRALKKPSSINCFRNLTSLKTLKIPLNSSVQTSNFEFASTSVTRLTIRLYGESFSIEWLLSMFPSVENLEITTSQRNTVPTEIRRLLDMNDNDGLTKVQGARKEYQKLRSLTIKKCTMHAEFFDFAKTSLPHLDELNLEIPLVLTSSSSSSHTVTTKFDLSNWHLNKCNLSFDSDYSFSLIHCITTIENISKDLLIDPSHKVLLPSANQYRAPHRYDRDMWVDIKWDRINQFKLYGYRIVKIGDTILIDT